MTKLGSRHLVPLACALVCALALLVLPQVALADSSYDGTFEFTVTGAITANPETSENFKVTPAIEEAESYLTIKKAGTYYLAGQVSEGYGAHVIVDTKDEVTLVFDGGTFIRSASDPALSFKTGSNVKLIGPSGEGGPVGLEDGTGNTDNAAIKVSKNSTCTFVSGKFVVIGNGAKADKKGNIKQNAIKGGAGTSIVFGDPSDESTGPSVTVGAEKGNGISSDGSLTFNKGTFNVGTSDKPVGKDGIKSVPDDGEDGEGTVTINGGTFAVYASDDGISAAKKVTITDCAFKGPDDDKPGLSANGHAITCAGDVEIAGGEFNHISAGGDGVHADGTVTIGTSGNEKPKMMIVSQEKPGAEGIKAAHVVLQGGFVLISSFDDAISGSDADGKTGLIELKGGMYTLHSYQGDAFDSNGDFVVTDGQALFAAENKDESLIDVLGSFDVKGGQLLGLGRSDQKMWLPTNGTYATANLGSGADAPDKGSVVHAYKKGDSDTDLIQAKSPFDKPTAFFYAGDGIANGDTVQFYEGTDAEPRETLLATATAKTNVGVTSVSLDRTTLQLAAGTSANLKARQRHGQDHHLVNLRRRHRDG